MNKKSRRIVALVIALCIGRLGVLWAVNNSNYITIVNMNWNTKFSNKCEEIFYRDNVTGPLGDGERYAIFSITEGELEKVGIDWAMGREKEMEKGAIVVLRRLYVSTFDYPPFEEPYKYTAVINGSEALYLFYFPKSQTLYVVESL